MVLPLLAARADRDEHEDDRVDVRGKGADRDEHVHGEVAAPQRRVRPSVEGEAVVQLDRCGEDQVDEDAHGQSGCHVDIQTGARARDHAEDHRDEEDGQCEHHGAREHAPPVGNLDPKVARGGHRLDVIRLQLGRVARLDDAREDGRNVDAACVVGDLAALAHQAHRCRVHALEREQSALDGAHARGTSHAVQGERHLMQMVLANLLAIGHAPFGALGQRGSGRGSGRGHLARLARLCGEILAQEGRLVPRGLDRGQHVLGG